jgi:hypothetical protein
MSRGLKSSLQIMAVAVLLMLSGKAFALPREGQEQRFNREQAVVKMVKKIVRALGDGLTIPRP